MGTDKAAQLNRSFLDRGQAMLMAVMIMMLAGAVVTALSWAWRNQARTAAYEQNRLRAFYAAQAGLEQAKMEAVLDPLLNGWFPCADDDDPLCWFQELPGADHKFRVTDEGGNLRGLTGIGVTRDAAGEETARQEMSVTVDIAAEAPVDWSWQGF